MIFFAPSDSFTYLQYAIWYSGGVSREVSYDFGFNCQGLKLYVCCCKTILRNENCNFKWVHTRYNPVVVLSVLKLMNQSNTSSVTQQFSQRAAMLALLFASAVLATAIPSVCPFVCLSHAAHPDLTKGSNRTFLWFPNVRILRFPRPDCCWGRPLIPYYGRFGTNLDIRSSPLILPSRGGGCK